MKSERDYVRVEEIEVRGNIREDFEEKGIRELADSIKAYGIIVPLVLRKAGGKFYLVDGERRLRAAKLIDLSEVPFTLAAGKIKDDEVKQLIANLHRKDFSSVELAKYYKKLSDNLGWTQSDIAKFACKTQAHVSQILKLNKLSKYQRKKIEKGESYAKVLKKPTPAVPASSPISGLSDEDKPLITSPPSVEPPEQTEDDATLPPSIIRKDNNDDEELLSFEISAASPDRIAQEIKLKLDEKEFNGIVRVSLTISKLNEKDMEKAFTDDGVYGFFDDAGNFTELT